MYSENEGPDNRITAFMSFIQCFIIFLKCVTYIKGNRPRPELTKLYTTFFIIKVIKLEKTGIDTIKYHTWPCKDNIWESDKNTRAKRSALSQQVTTRQQWTDAKTWLTQDINNTNDPQKRSTQLSTKFHLLVKTKMLKNEDFYFFQTLGCWVYHVNKC